VSNAFDELKQVSRSSAFGHHLIDQTDAQRFLSVNVIAGQ